MDSIDRFIERKLRRDRRIRAEFGGPEPPTVDRRLVDRVAYDLGITFPPSYRKLVTTTALQHGDRLYWVTRKADHPRNILARQPRMAPFLVAIMAAGDGGEYCFDMREAGPGGEYPVVRWEREFGEDPDRAFDPVAPDLGSFLLEHEGGPPGTAWWIDPAG